MSKVFFMIVALVCTTICLELSQNEIDNVEQLLAQLKGTSQLELNQLEEDYENSHAAKLAIIEALQTTVQNQNGECNARDQDFKDRQNDISMSQAYIKWLNGRLSANEARVVSLRENRCAQNRIFIEGLRNQKISLRLVIFLRNALQQAKDSDFSLIQQHQMGSFVVQFLSIYKHAQRPELLQLTKEIEDTFNFQIDVENDDNVALLEQVTLSGTKLELIDILNQIESDLRSSLANSQDQEVRVGIQLAEFFAQLAQENITLEQLLGDQGRRLISLGNQLTTAQTTAANCRSRLSQLQLTVTASQQDLDSQTNLYNSQHTRLESEVALFDDVYRIYSKQVATSDDKFKSRVQDYVQSFVSKSTTKESNLQGSVAQAIREQTAREVA